MKYIKGALGLIGHIVYATWWILVASIVLPLYVLFVAIIYLLWGVSMVLGYIGNVYYRELVRLNIIR